MTEYQNRRKCCDHPLDQSCSDASRDRLYAIEAEMRRRGVGQYCRPNVTAANAQPRENNRGAA